MSRILVVDDEIGIRELLSEILYNEGYTVVHAENAQKARQARDRDRPDLILLDIWMPDTDGLTLLKEWNMQGLLDMPVIMMSGHATIETAVEATRIGAIDFLEKPISLKRLLKTVKSALAKRQNSSVNIPNSISLNNFHKNYNKEISNNVSNGNSFCDKQMQSVQSVIMNSTTTVPVTSYKKLESITLDQPLREARDAFEKIYFEYHLIRSGYSMTRISEQTGLERTHLYRKFKQLGIQLTRMRES